MRLTPLSFSLAPPFSPGEAASREVKNSTTKVPGLKHEANEILTDFGRLADTTPKYALHFD
jgi:hypothetical protein